MAPETSLTLPDGRTVVLRRHAALPQPDNVRAWDAADELALLHLAEQPPSDRVLVCDDRFGALSVGLAPHGIAWWGDSVAAAAATAANLDRNDLPQPTVWRTSVQDPPTDGVGVAVVRVPRATAVLEDVLARLAAALPPGTPVVGAAMTKQVRSATVEAFERLVGPTRTTRARKKARLLLAAAAPGRDARPPDVRTRAINGLTVAALPGVFAGGRLDAGTELLLSVLPDLAETLGRADVIDLGCGTGIVGAVVAARHPDARVTFTDDSARAVASARATMDASHPGRPASFLHADALDGLEAQTADVVLVNPPFHQGREMTDAIAWRMFSDARRVLRPGGLIVAVGNQHLGHHAKLARLYGGSDVLASNPRFVVVGARRR